MRSGVEEYGQEYGHHETKEGPVTSGSYFVMLPDGRRQTVHYSVTGTSGFVASVNYENYSIE